MSGIISSSLTVVKTSNHTTNSNWFRSIFNSRFTLDLTQKNAWIDITFPSVF